MKIEVFRIRLRSVGEEGKSEKIRHEDAVGNYVFDGGFNLEDLYVRVTVVVLCSAKSKNSENF